MTTYTELTSSSYLSAGETLAGTNGGSSVDVAVSGARGTQGVPGFGFWLGDGNAGPIGGRNETVTTTFSRSVDSVQIRLDAIHGDGLAQSEGVRILINGQVYNLTSANLSSAGPNIGINSQGYIINTGPNNGVVEGVTVTITVPGGINSLGLEYYERVTNVSGSGVTARVYVDTDPPTTPCFASGTLIQTRQGEISVEDLVVGDEVLTLDHGYQELLWVGSFESDGSEHQQPIQINAGAFGPGLPHSDLLVSPQHRIMLTLETAKAEFGCNQILIPAKKIQMLSGVTACTKFDEPFTYFHLVFQRHEVIMSNGLPTESFYCGEQASSFLGQRNIDEIQKVRPEFGCPNYVEAPARPIVERKKQIERLLEAELLAFKIHVNAVIGTPSTSATQSSPENAQVSTLHPSFSCCLDGHISCSRANTNGKIDDIRP